MRFRLDPRLALGAALAAGAVLPVAPATAQYLYPPRVVAPLPAPVPHFGPIPPHEIAQRMMRRGFLEIDPPQMRGDIYVVTGINRNGDRVRLVLDAYDGEILRRTRYESDADLAAPSYSAPVTAYPRPPRTVPYGNREIRVIEREETEESFDERRVQRDIPPPQSERAPAPRRTSKLEQPKRTPTAKPTETPREDATRISPAPANPAPAAQAPQPPAPPRATAAASDIRVPEPPAVPAPEVKAAPETTGTARPVRVIEGVTPAPADAGKVPE